MELTFFIFYFVSSDLQPPVKAVGRHAGKHRNVLLNTLFGTLTLDNSFFFSSPSSTFFSGF